MKIAITIFKFFPYGGLQLDFLHIARECAQRGHTVDVYTTSWEGEQPENMSITVMPIALWTNHQHVCLFAKKIKKILQETKYDVVVGFNKMPYLDVYFAGDVCLKAKILRERKFLYWVFARYRRFLWLEKSIFDPAAKTQIILLTEQQKKEFQQYYHTQEERFHILPPGIAKNLLLPAGQQKIRKEFRARMKVKADETLLLLIASDFQRKGLDRAIESVAFLEGSPIQLAVVGSDRMAHYRRLAKKLGVANRVTFYGAQDGLIRHMLAADVLIHPSRLDSAGMVLLEALTAGLPVLTTASCGYAYHIERAKAGLVVPLPFQQHKLNHALREMLDKNKQKIWRANALAYVDHTDLYSLAEKAADLIEKCQHI